MTSSMRDIRMQHVCVACNTYYNLIKTGRERERYVKWDKLKASNRPIQKKKKASNRHLAYHMRADIASLITHPHKQLAHDPAESPCEKNRNEAYVAPPTSLLPLS
jgi:hypothetical protein